MRLWKVANWKVRWVAWTEQAGLPSEAHRMEAIPGGRQGPGQLSAEVETMSTRKNSKKRRQSIVPSDLIIIEFSRASIVSNDFSSALERLEPLRAAAGTAMEYEGTLSFAFTGWDADAREIYQIPEIRKWFEDLTDRFGYWVHYCEKTGSTISLLMSLLCAGQIVRNPDSPGMVGWLIDADTIPVALEFLMDKHVALYKQLGIDDDVRDRVAFEFSQAVDAFLD